jgi:5'-nucleotidase
MRSDSARWWLFTLAFSCGVGVSCAPPGPGPDAGAPGADAGAPDAGLVAFRVLAFNDFHGALAAASLPDGGTSGGAASLAAHVAARRDGATVLVSAGDLVGGSTIESAYFHDEPTVAVMNELGLALSAIGNHELDEGLGELQRLQQGGCHASGCAPGRPWGGATFQFLSANLHLADGGARPFPAWAVEEVGGAKVGFIGVTPRDTAAEVPAFASQGLEFRDEVASIQAVLPELRAQGVDVVLVLLHEGGAQTGGPGECVGFGGAVEGMALALQGQVAALISGHTHRAYACKVGDVLVTAAGSHGAYLTQLDFVVSTLDRVVLAATTQNVEVSSALPPEPRVAGLVAGWGALLGTETGRVVATITTDLPAADNLAGESPMGDVIADAMLAGTRGAPHHAVAALMNRGGVRASLLYARSGMETADGQVTLAEAFAVQPFSNEVETVTLSGRALAEALDHHASPSSRPLQVAGLVYTRRPSAPAGQRVTVADVVLGGAPLEADRTYRVTVNSMVGNVATTPAMAAATERTPAGIDLDLLVAHLAASSPVGLPAGGRLLVE